MSTTVAFIVDAKNEEDTVRLASAFKSQLNAAKVVATRTEKNKLESVIDKKSIVFTTSLDVQGEKTISAKASRGEVNLLVYLNPPVSDEAMLPRFVDLLQQSLKKHTLLALNYETAETILNYMTSKGSFAAVSRSATESPSTTSSSTNKGTLGRQASVAALQLLRSSTVADKHQNRRVMNWSKQQLLYWLESNELDYLKSLFSSEGETNVPTEASMFDKHDSKSNMLYIKFGKPEKLVDLLVSSKDAAIRELFEYDEFVRDWFMTFHIFLSPEEFLKLLRAKYVSALEDYEEEEGQEIIDAIIHILNLWVDLEKGADFDASPSLRSQFDDFVALIEKKDKEAANKLKESLVAAIEFLQNPPEPDVGNAPAPMLTKKKYPPGVVPPITELEPLELAKQMTLMESLLLRKVRAKEFHGTAWAKRDAEVRAPNLTKVINMSNQLSNWMITEILKLGTVGEMAEAIIKFIRVGKHFVQMNNFSGAMEVATALNNSAIGKLKAAWAALPPKTKAELDELNELTSPLGHYKNYRAAFANRDPEQPCLPILAATLSDLNGFEEVFSNAMPDGSVNWKKMSRLADRIWENVSLNCIYAFRPAKELIDYIESAFVWRESATTCAIADLRMKEIAKQGDKAAQDRRIRRKSTSSVNLSEQLDGPKEELSEREWQILLTGAQPKKFKAGQFILKAGSANEHLFRVKSGKVKVMKEIDGQEVGVATMGENAMFGEVSMLLRSQKGTATASIVADGDVELYQLQIEFVLQLLEAHPNVAEKLNRILAIKLARRLREVGTKKAPPPPSPSAGSESQAQGAASPALKDSKSKRSLKKDAADSAPMESTPEEESRPKDSGADKSDSPDAKFNKMFKLDGEVIIREIECSFKGSITMHGSLFVSQNYLGANFSMFGFKMREALPFSSIKDIKKSKKNINIVLNEDGKVYSFTGFQDYEDAFQFIRSIWKHQSGQKAPAAPTKSSKKDKAPDAAAASSTSSPAGDDEETPTSGDASNKWLPSAEDWDLILKGARTVTYKKDDVVIREGEQFRRIFQLARGECRFEKIIDGKSKVLGKMGKDSKDDNLFGEISFLEGGRASASVVCDKDDTQIAIIEGYFLEILFEYYPDLPGRFYHYLAAVLSKRLKQRESGMAAPAPVGGSKDTLKESGGSDDAAPREKSSSKDKDKKHKKKKSSAKELTKSGSSAALSVSASEDEEAN